MATVEPDPSLTDWITAGAAVVAAVATIAAAIGAVVFARRQTRILARQNEIETARDYEAQRPYLVLTPGPLDRLVSPTDRSVQYWRTVIVHNIGQGPALDVTLTYEQPGGEPLEWYRDLLYPGDRGEFMFEIADPEDLSVSPNYAVCFLRDRRIVSLRGELIDVPGQI